MATIYIHGGQFTFTVSGVTVTPTAGAIYYIGTSPYNFYITSTNIVAGAGTITGAYAGNSATAIASSGTLTKTSGTGDATISFSARTCPSTCNWRDVRYANGDTIQITNNENANVTLLCDASDAATSPVNGSTYTDAQTIENILPAIVNNASTNSTVKVKNTSTTVPLIVKMNSVAGTNGFVSSGKTAKVVFEGASGGTTQWISIGTGTGATGQTIQMNTIPSVATKYIDNPPFVQVETSAGSGTYITYLNIGGNYANYANTAYVAPSFLSECANAVELGRYFEYDEYNGGAGYGKIIFATASGGYPPPNGSNIRIPNIHVTASGAAGTTVASRCAMQATYLGQGYFDLQGCSFSDRFTFGATNQYFSYFNAKDVGVSGSFLPGGIGNSIGTGAFIANGLYVCPDKWVLSQSGVIFGSNIVSINVNDIVVATRGTGTTFTVQNTAEEVLTACDNIRATTFARSDTFRNNIYFSSVKHSGTTPLDITNIYSVGNPLSLNGLKNIRFKNYYHSDTTTGVATTSNGVSALLMSSCDNCIVETMRIVTGGSPCYSHLIGTSNYNNNCAIHDVIYDGAGVAGADHTYTAGGIGGTRIWLANFTVNNLRSAGMRAQLFSSQPARASNIITDTASIASYIAEGAFSGATQYQIECVSGTNPPTGLSTLPDNNTFYVIRTASGVGTLGIIWGSLMVNKAYRTVVSGTEGTDFYLSGNVLNIPKTGVNLVYSTDKPIKGIKNSATAFSGATLTANGTNASTSTTYKFRMSRWGTALSGGYTTMSAANLQTAFDAIRDATISTDGINMDIEIATSADNSTRAPSYYNVSGVELDTAFAPTEVGFIQIGHTDATSGASLALYENSTPASPVLVQYTASVSGNEQIEFPYDYNGVAASYRFIARKAGYAEKSVSSTCWQAGTSVPMAQSLNYACTDATVAGITINGAAETITHTGTKTWAQVYQEAQYWSHQQANMLYDVPVTTTDGVNFILPTGWVYNNDALPTTGTMNGGTWKVSTTGTYTAYLASSKIDFATAGTYDLSASVVSGTIELINSSGGAVTVTMPTGSSVLNTGPNITVNYPTTARGLYFTGLVAGSTVKVYDTGTTTERFSTTNSGTTETWSEATSGSVTVDYTICKNGYTPIRVTGVTVTGATSGGVITTPIQQAVDNAYAASSGLTLGVNVTIDPTTKAFTLSAASTVQNFYSFVIEQYTSVAQTNLKNKAFPMSPFGSSSFDIKDGWVFSDGATSINYLTNDGMRYLNTSGNPTKVWAAFASVGVPTGEQARYQQTDAGTTVNTENTGNFNQLIQIMDDPNGDGVYTDGYDYRGWMVFKVQADGYDQAEVNVLTMYNISTLEPTLYTLPLTPTSNGLATGNPSPSTAPTISQGTYVYAGKTFSVKIVDGATPNTGTIIQRWLRYNFELGGTFQGEDAFNWHDLVQTNGSNFKTVRGTVYGTATTKGVIVYKNDGTTLHPDFDLFTADDGTTYSPPVTANISITGMVDTASAYDRLQIINTTAISASAWQASTAYALGDIVLRTTGVGTESTAGLYMRCTTAGTSGGTEPTWDTTVGNTTADNTVTWTTYAVLYYDADPTSTAYSGSYIDGEEFLAGETVTVRFAEMDAGTTFKTYSTTAIAATSGFTIAMTVVSDDVFATNGLNGFSYDGTFSPNYTSNYIVLDTNTDFTGKSAYAYYCYLLTTSQGMYNFWGGITALDVGNYRIETDVVSMYFDESAGFVKQTDDVRIYRKDGARPALDPTTGLCGIEMNWKTPVSVVTSGSGLTPTQETQLTTAASKSTTAVSLIGTPRSGNLADDLIL